MLSKTIPDHARVGCYRTQMYVFFQIFFKKSAQAKGLVLNRQSSILARISSSQLKRTLRSAESNRRPAATSSRTADHKSTVAKMRMMYVLPFLSNTKLRN
jgi:hypothetical protein